MLRDEFLNTAIGQALLEVAQMERHFGPGDELGAAREQHLEDVGGFHVVDDLWVVTRTALLERAVHKQDSHGYVYKHGFYLACVAKDVARRRAEPLTPDDLLGGTQ